MNRENPNMFSYWFPKVKDCGLKVPKSFWTKVPIKEDERLYQAFFGENYLEDIKVIKEWVDENVMPHLEEAGITGRVFLKNGTFSNKFQANRSCITFSKAEIPEHLLLINYQSMCCGAGGMDEIVVRELIPINTWETPTIYEGLPLVPEFRVFYDFDRQSVIFTENYWNYHYCIKGMYEASDRIVFTHRKMYLNDVFRMFKRSVEEIVDKAMRNVEGLNGQWSIDIMYANDEFWLIDMAVAQNSAYWENRPDKKEYPK